MSENSVEQLSDPNHKDMADVLNLFKGIKSRTCTAAAYLDYLNTNWINIGMFIIRNTNRIIGFTQAEAPGVLEPKIAWLPFSHTLPECTCQKSSECLRMAENWMKGFGATKYRFTTVLKPELLERRYGMKRSKEILMEKDLSDD